MAGKPLSSDAIAITEKKVDMALDDIIKLSKNSTKGKKQRRIPNKNQKPVNGGAAKEAVLKVRRYMDSRSSVRQGFLARRRSSFQQNHFPLAAEAAQKAAVAPIRGKANNAPRGVNSNKPRTRAPPSQNRSRNGGFAAKPRQQDRNQQQKPAPKQKPQTLDSLFANLKEERTRASSNQNNPAQRNGNGGSSGWRRPPWMRRQFGN